MKTKLEIFTTEKLKNFFSNLEDFFHISIIDYSELCNYYDSNFLKLIFLDESSTISKKIEKNIFENENTIFICKDFSIFQKFPLSQKNVLISPVSINKLIDFVNNFINTKKHTFMNIELKNHIINNSKTNEKIYLTEAENYILLKLFDEKNIKKKSLERDALQIKQDLNTSSMESHLNRIRKKLKKISSDFSISSKENYVYLEIINQDK
tara:strand:+ start:779 stop:1405 length:627 start_codon:yes stop_codon:yes gene_type:complete